MAGFFQKVMWVECTGKNDPKCLKFINKERLPAFRKRCSDCGSDTREVVKSDQAKILAAAALLAVLVGGGWWAASSSLRGAVSRVGHIDSGRETPPEHDTGREASRITLAWTVETDQNGNKRKLTPSEDFSEDRKVFVTKDAFHEGDRFRLSASTSPAKMTYIFYKNGGDVRRLAADDGGRVTAPVASDEWFKLDANPGMEEFILVAANGRQGRLDDLPASNIDPGALDKQVRELAGKKDVSLVRVQVRHE